MGDRISILKLEKAIPNNSAKKLGIFTETNENKYSFLNVGVLLEVCP